jgi:hypothetical protein
MVEALASDRSGQPLNVTVLSWRAWRDRAIADAHSSQPACNRGTIRRVTVSKEIARCLLAWECFGNMPGDPLGGRCCDEQIKGGDLGRVIAQNAPATIRFRIVRPLCMDCLDLPTTTVLSATSLRLSVLVPRPDRLCMRRYGLTVIRTKEASLLCRCIRRR